MTTALATRPINVEREKRKTLRAEQRAKREDQLWQIIQRPEVLNPLVGVGGAIALQQIGKHRVIDRDFAGFALAAWVALCAAQAGISDKWALGAFTALATAAYSVTVPPTEEEALITIDVKKPLGGDGKLFFLDVPFIPADW